MSFYLILGLSRDAKAEEIRRAYRRLARKYHPGINPGDRAAAEFFRQITEAYETLTDPERRRRYDAHDDSQDAGPVPAFEFAGFDFSVRVDGQHASTFGELFADVLPGGLPAAQGPVERGADLHVPLTLTLDDVARGAERAVTVTRLERCGSCSGRGFLGGAQAPCQLCDGSGTLRGARGHMVFARTCGGCGGTGIVRHHVCRACGGEGVGVRSDVTRVRVPAGVADGAHLTVPGLGHAGRRGGPPGDLRIAIAVAPHPVFRRSGDDLLLDLPVAVHEAALGARVEVPCIDGPLRVRIPPGTPSGQTLRFRGRGLPSMRDGERGDLILSVKLVLPRVLDERSKELLREFGRIQAENVRQHLFGEAQAKPGTTAAAGQEGQPTADAPRVASGTREREPAS